MLAETEEEKQIVKRMVKEDLFRDKKLSEENVVMEQNLKEYERKKELKKILKRFENIEWDEDVNHDSIEKLQKVKLNE